MRMSNRHPTSPLCQRSTPVTLLRTDKQCLTIRCECHPQDFCFAAIWNNAQRLSRVEGAGIDNVNIRGVLVTLGEGNH